MARFVVRRLLLSFVTLLLLIIVVFLLTRVFPSDPARQLAGPFAPQERVDKLNEDLGLTDPLLVQLGGLVRDAVTLDFGESFSQPGVRVLDLIGPALGNSARLVALALLLTLPLVSAVANRRSARVSVQALGVWSPQYSPSTVKKACSVLA